MSLAEAMMVGPIAHRLQLPVLMTAADELPSATADFIEAEDIEHIVIVGGTEGVSEDVANAVSDAGVDTVDRVAGDTPAGTSVALAELAFNGCSDDLLPVSGDTVALVHRDALPDGVAAAPVLTSTFASGDLVPILVVGDTLPASVRDYLAATPAEDGKIDANDVPAPGDMAVNLYFSDDVIAEDAALEGNSAFDAMSEVKLPADAAAGCGATSNIALAIGNDDRQVTTVGGVTGGMTQVAIEVRFNGYVNTVSDDELLDDILADLVKRTEATDDAAARTALGLDSLTATPGPTTMVRYEAITGQANQLPQVRDLVTTLAGHDGASEITGPPLVPAIDDVEAVATGYAPDANAPGRTVNDTAHDKVDEDQNGASQVRIGRSSSVKVPPTPTN